VVARLGVSDRVADRKRSLGEMGDAGAMARGDHPMRTPVYGALLIIGAMIGSVVVWQGSEPTWLRNSLMVGLLLVAVAGWLMTFRDLSPPRRRRR
jgi:hypothetical protein